MENSEFLPKPDGFGSERVRIWQHLLLYIYINPLSKDYSVLTGLANKLAEQRRDTLILVGGDFNCRSSSELCNLALHRSDRRVQRYHIICNIFKSIGCFDQKSKSEWRLDYIFSTESDEITTLTTLYTNYSDHNALHACFSNFQDFMLVNGRSYWKLNYNVVREHNKPSELVETLQGLSDESLKLPLSGTNLKPDFVTGCIFYALMAIDN